MAEETQFAIGAKADCSDGENTATYAKVSTGCRTLAEGT